MNEPESPHWTESLQRSWKVPLFERLNDRIRSLSAGDKVIWYTLVGLVILVSIMNVYSLEQKMLVEVPTYGGSLTEGEIGSPQFINPLLAISDADRDLSTLTYSGLMGLADPELASKGELTPVLAESYTISPDGKTYTFIIRKGALFSDGSPVTANDVVFTVQKAQDSSLKSPEYANWSGVRVVALDPRTVQFTLTKAYAPFLGLTTLGILPARLWQNVGSNEFPFPTLETPIGAGPYQVTNISRNASGLIKSVSLKANSHFVFGRPYIDTLRFNFYSRSEDLASAVLAGEVESVYDMPSSDSKTQVLTAPYARVFGVFWNPGQAQVYARTEVRKALSIALDRNAITKNILGGYATAIQGPVPPGGAVKQVAITQEADPIEAAAKILQAAGWEYDGTLRAWKNASTKQSLDRITIRTSNVPELKSVASAVKVDWEKFGIPVDVELYEPGDLSQNVIRPRNYEALLYGMVIGRDQDLYAFWDSQERNDPGLNIALYANKTVDTLLEDARTTSDETARLNDLQKIEDTVAAEYPAAFIYAPDFTYAVPRNVGGVVLPQIITPSDRFATVALWYRETDKIWPFFTK